MGEQKKRNVVVFLNEHMVLAARLLSAEKRGRLFEAIRCYSMDGVLPDLKKEKEPYLTVFEMMKNSQDRYIEQYERTCEKNRSNANKRWELERSDASGMPSHTSGKKSYAKNANTIQSNTIQNNPNQYNTEHGCAASPSLVKEGVTEETGVTGVTGVGWL